MLVIPMVVKALKVVSPLALILKGFQFSVLVGFLNVAKFFSGKERIDYKIAKTQKLLSVTTSR